MYRRILGLASYLALPACNLDSGICTLSIEPAVVVVVQDSVTGLPAAQGSTGQVTDGSFSDPLRPAGYDGGGTLISLAAASERPGRYTVQVQRSGYLNWSRSNVRALKGDCHVQTVTIVARLVPAP